MIGCHILGAHILSAINRYSTLALVASKIDFMRASSVSPCAGAVVSGFQDVAAVRQSVEEGCGHFGVAEDAGPFGAAEVGGNGDAGSFVELAEQVDQQGAA
jgi:hypothetical protein